jgi:hypothetical protein
VALGPLLVAAAFQDAIIDEALKPLCEHVL